MLCGIERLFFLSPAPVGRFPFTLLRIIREHAAYPREEDSNNFCHRPIRRRLRAMAGQAQTDTDRKYSLRLYGDP